LVIKKKFITKHGSMNVKNLRVCLAFSTFAYRLVAIITFNNICMRLAFIYSPQKLEYSA